MKKIDGFVNDPESTLAERLRGFRLRAGFSQQNIADVLNVSRSTYTYYETGKTSPDPATLNRIAKILGVSLEEFFPENGSGTILEDSEGKRPSKTVCPDPQRVGELSAGEKTLIAFVRDNRFPPEAAIDALKRLRDRLEDERKTY